MGKTAADSAAKNVKKRSASENRGGVVNKTASASVLSENIFTTLMDNDAGNPLADLKNSKPKPATIGEQPERKEKCPPIFVHGDPSDLRPALRLLITEGLKCTFRLCTEGVKLMTEEKAHYNKVLNYLKEKQFQYYTHDDPGTKPLKVILRGLDDMEIKELLQELKDCGLKPENAYKIARHDKSRKYRDQLFLVHLERGSTTLMDLKDVRVINSTIVEWQRYKPVQRDVTQCMNCLRFGHGTKNCFMATRCERCGEENHGLGECKKIEEAEPTCANCKQNHLATAKICVKRAAFLEIRKRASTKDHLKKKTGPPPAPARDGKNYPELHPPRRGVPNLPPLQAQQRLKAVAASVGSQAPSPQAPPASTSNQGLPPLPPGFQQPQDNEPLPPEDAAPLYTSKELASLFNEFVAILRSCKTRLDQVHRLGLFAIEHGY